MAIHPETERVRVMPAPLRVNPSAMAIHVGAKFNSFAEFEQEFRVFQVTTNTLFVTKLEITELKVEHNHEVSPEIFRTYPECRQLNTEEINFVKSLRELNVRPSLIVEKLREQSGR
ncbi:hypothetical protein IscW_ISCW016218 [Ixodes scapularis]|uniref:Uncharacterized protein n=1 Tax=Ixodes scapularis TaxID=6945 RepID=B7P0N5_IXOSC|nr:hypothetical protein IscW_ISCW016218 [Ixodes scapularis]|eukprot:XP_002399316.1 hypothetical protein IscW_ISCW016218 [Ixodes scapularis]